MTRKALLLICLLLLPLAACAVHIPQPSPHTPLELAAPPVAEAELSPGAADPAEAQLLDIAIAQFTFAPPLLQRGTPDPQLADIRKAEARYMPVMLRHTLGQSGNWGEVHVLPQVDTGHDLRIEGEILDSEAHTLKLRIAVHDATGARWFENVYTQHVGARTYGDDALGVNDPFSGLYNRIANDMLLQLRQRDAAALAQVRQVAELRFGNDFVPEVYGGYLAEKRGIVSIDRLPPATDPAVLHLRQIRQRDRAFQDLLQQRYVDFARDISDSYFEYRRQGFRELQQLQRQQKDARNDIVGGAVLLGVAMATSNIDDALATMGAATAAVVGTVKIVQGVAAYGEESPFIGELQESFSQEVVTEVVAIDEEVVTLSGTTESIYAQWKELLRALFREDRSLPME